MLGIKIRYEGLIILLLSLCFLPSGPHAASNWSFDDPHKTEREYIEDEPWKEGGSALPSFPRDENLVDLRLDYPGSRFSYFLDSESLKLGDDGVVRYTLLIRSASGGSNVMFEGMLCNDKAYKTYGYGTGKGKFQVARNPKWRPIRESGSKPYRYDMWKQYFCFAENELGSRDREEILRAIKYPKNTGGGFSQ